MRLQHQVALITGAAKGIGRAIALKLASEGCHVVINYYNSSDLAESLCEEIRRQGVEAIAVQANVSDPTSVKEMMQLVHEKFGKLDILISNAASGVLKPTMQMSAKHFRWCTETNALSLVYLLQQAESLMAPGSRVVALTSMGSQRVIPDYGFIGASKAALESLVRSLSVELAPKGIILNTVCAGAVDTDALAHFPERERLLRQSEERSLAGRNVTPDDVANVVALLCFQEASMIRGQTIVVDAGYSIIG